MARGKDVLLGVIGSRRGESFGLSSKARISFATSSEEWPDPARWRRKHALGGLPRWIRGLDKACEAILQSASPITPSTCKETLTMRRFLVLSLVSGMLLVVADRKSTRLNSSH